MHELKFILAATTLKPKEVFKIKEKFRANIRQDNIDKMKHNSLHPE
jgi:hypothetical protein